MNPKHLTYTNNIEGWIAGIELAWLHNEAKAFSTIVEIGAYKAKSATAFCDAIPNGMVYSVDIFADPEAAIFSTNLGVRANHKLIRKASLDAAMDFKDRSVGMVFLDGDHSYESARDDIAAWTPKAARIICGHDYVDDNAGHWPGVVRAVNEAFDNIELVGSLWVVRL